MTHRPWSWVFGGGLLLLSLGGLSGFWARPDWRGYAPSQGVTPHTSPACRHALAAEDYVIDITGSDNRWQVRYPGAPQTIDSVGEEMARLELHVPEQRSIVLRLHSTDYVYTLELPHWELKEIAVPRLEFELRFRTSDRGRFDLVGDHLCGGVVETLQGALVVESAPQLCHWLTQSLLPEKVIPPES